MNKRAVDGRRAFGSLELKRLDRVKYLAIMGTWGGGNFENDGALDYLDGVMDGLVAQIEECFETEDGADLDGEGESELVPTVEILSVLHDHFGGKLPEVSTVEAWKNKYLEIFDDQIDALEPGGDYKKKRRQVIETTFDRLIEQSR